MATNEHKSKNVIFLALSGIGNLLMQLPTIEAFKKANPQARVTVWVAPRGTKAIAESCSYIDSVIEAPIKASPAEHMRMSWKLARHRFDTGIVLSPGQLVKSATYLFLAGVPTRIGNAYLFQGRSESGFLLTHAITEDPDLHDIEQNLRLLEPLEVPTQKSWGKSYHFNVPAEHVTKAQEYLSSQDIPSDRKLVAIHAGSAPAFLWKRWPLDRFAAVARTLINEQNVHILLLGGPDEEDQKEQLHQLIGLPNITNVSTPLLTTAAILQQSSYLLTNDSGIMHLAAAVGTPVFGLYGPTDEKKTGPRGDKSIVIRAAGTTPVYATETNYDIGETSHPTMLEITPELVLETIQSNS
ncbi:MAG: glycosyltransferase family 9 protein [Candidatus Andersenbacteria bacterium]